MVWRRYLFDVLFRIGRPVWDTPTPPEVCAVVEGTGRCPRGVRWIWGAAPAPT